MEQYSVRTRLFLTLIVLLIPVCLLTAIILYNMISVEKRYLRDKSLAAFEQSVLQADYMFERLESEALIRANVFNKHLASDDANASNQNELSLSQALSQMELVFPQLKPSVFFYVRGDDSIYSKDGKTLYHQFEQKYVDYNLNVSKLFTRLTTLNESSFLRLRSQSSESTNGGMVAYIVTLTGTAKQTANIIYMFRENAIKEIFSNFLGNYISHAYIYDATMNVLLSEEVDVLPKSLYGQIQRLNGVGLLETSFDNIPYITFRHVSTPMRLTYTVLCTRDNFFSTVVNRQIMMTIFIVILTICLIVLSFLLSNKLFRPLRHLINDIAGDEAENSRNEFEIIRATYVASKRKTEILRSQLQEQRIIVSEHVIRLLINGSIQTQEELSYYGHSLGIPLDKPKWAVMLISLPASKNRWEPLETYINGEMAEALGEPLENAYLLTTELEQEQCFCLIINYDPIQPDSDSSDIPIPQLIYEQILLHDFPGIKVGVGLPYKSAQEIKRSFYEAGAALRTIASDHRESIAFFNRALPSNERLELSPMDKSLLIEYISHGDFESASETLNLIIESITVEVTSFICVRLLCNDLLSLLMNFSRSEGMPVDQTLLRDMVLFTRIEEFRAMAQSFIKAMCENRQIQIEDNLRDERKMLLSSINSYYKKGDFSLEYLSEITGLSRNKISGILKEAVGQGFSQYISLLRMNEVKRLLLQTDKSIQDIVWEAGYLDVSNFTRKFKAQEGITLGQYRLLNSVKKNVENHDK